MTDSRAHTKEAPHLLTTLKDDVGRMVADVKKHGLGQVGGTLSELETFYLDEDARERLSGMGTGRRYVRRFSWLLKSLLMKLTPTRRVLLALGLFFLAVGNFQLRSANVHITVPAFGPIFIIFVLMLELKDKLVARHELEAGRSVQFALMPESTPAIPGWDVWLYTRPANDVGGDLVDHVPIDTTHHGVALGDVAGKALPAALLMVKLQATLRALVPEFPDLAQLGVAMNRILYRDGLPNRFATLVYLVLATDGGDVGLLNAGHMPPLIVRGDTIEELPRGSIALGMLPTPAFEEQRVHLAPGDTLIVYSDGVVEAMNPAEDFFGDERLRAAIAASTRAEVPDLGGRILRDINDFAGYARPHDDISLVVVRRRASH